MSETGFVDVCLHVQYVGQPRNYAGYGSIAGPLAKPVDRDVYALESRSYGFESVRDRETIVIVGVEVEVQAGIALDHVGAELPRLLGTKHS